MTYVIGEPCIDVQDRACVDEYRSISSTKVTAGCTASGVRSRFVPQSTGTSDQQDGDVSRLEFTRVLKLPVALVWTATSLGVRHVPRLDSRCRSRRSVPARPQQQGGRPARAMAGLRGRWRTRAQA